MRFRMLIPALLLLGGCATVPVGPRLEALLPADALLLGEQHDAPQHQRLQRDVVAWLAARGQLAAVALEMAPAGGSTAGLSPQADEEAVRQALNWREQAWPWASYGPAVMVAVRAGVPVLGANLPVSEMRAAMGDALLDRQLPGPALKAQQQLIRLGHCGLLPETQIGPMARVQIARDRAMAEQLTRSVRAGQVVLLIAGAGHTDRQLGVPQHLPASLQVKVVKLQAGADGGAAGLQASADATWVTPALPPRDYCAEMRKP